MVGLLQRLPHKIRTMDLTKGITHNHNISIIKLEFQVNDLLIEYLDMDQEDS
jgi:hypothetical protein